MDNLNKEKIAFFAFSFVILAVGGPCGMLDKYLTVGNVTVTPVPSPTVNQVNQTAATHFTCENSYCVETPGAGSDECASNYDCTAAAPQNQSPPPSQPPPAPLVTHTACVNQACVDVQGPGTDSCSSDTDCVTYQPQGCAVYTDCSTCLKRVPGQCKWCIQGSVCSAVSDTSSCFGGLGWLTQDYQCNLATR